MGQSIRIKGGGNSSSHNMAHYSLTKGIKRPSKGFEECGITSISRRQWNRGAIKHAKQSPPSQQIISGHYRPASKRHSKKMPFLGGGGGADSEPLLYLSEILYCNRLNKGLLGGRSFQLVKVAWIH